MSVHEPPGGRQPEGAPGYAQPQDPWGGDGFDTGVASVPTDPIPQPYGYNQYDRSGVWSQETMPQAQPQQLPWVPQQPQRSRAVRVVLTLLAVLVVGGGGGYGAYYFATHRPGTTGVTNSPTAGVHTTPPATGPTSTARDWALELVNVGDCIGVDAARTDNPKPHFATCAKGAYQVIAIKKGDQILQDGDGVLVQQEAWDTCATTNYSNYYAYDDKGTANDYVLCLSVVK